MYNQFVQGNAELLSIASDDSIWNSNDEDDEDGAEEESAQGDIDVVETSDGEGGKRTAEACADGSLLEDDLQRQSKYKKSMLQRFLSDSFQQQQRQDERQEQHPQLGGGQDGLRRKRKRSLSEIDEVARDSKRRPRSPPQRGDRPQVLHPKAIHLAPPPPPPSGPHQSCFHPRPPPLPFHPILPLPSVLPAQLALPLMQPMVPPSVRSVPLYPPALAASQPLPPTLQLLSGNFFKAYFN